MGRPTIFTTFTKQRAFPMHNNKKLGTFSLFNLWAGAAISLAEIMTGGLFAPLGLLRGILLILAGHLIGCLLLSLTGLIGFREKKPALIASRMAFGRYGSYLISAANIIQLIGWTAIMLIQCANSISAITSKLAGFTGFALFVVIVGAIVAVWVFVVDKGGNALNSAAVILLFVLCLLILGLVIGGRGMVSSPGTRSAATTLSVGAALEMSIVMPLTWLPIISDYTMWANSAKASFWGSFSGYFIASSFMYITGLTAVLFTGSSDIATIILHLSIGVAGLLVVVLSTVTTTYLDVYSAVMSILNIAPKISKRLLILLISALGTLIALFFPMEQYENFLYAIGSIFAPAFAVVLLDYFVFRADRSTTTFNVPGILSAVIGTATYYFFMKLDLPAGSTVPSMLLTAVVYVVFRSVLKDRNAQKC